MNSGTLELMQAAPSGRYVGVAHTWLSSQRRSARQKPTEQSSPGVSPVGFLAQAPPLHQEEEHMASSEQLAPSAASVTQTPARHESSSAQSLMLWAPHDAPA